MKKLLLILLCAVSLQSAAQMSKGLSVRLPDYKGNGVYQKKQPSNFEAEDNEVAYSKYDEVFDRTNYYNKSNKLLFYKIWNEAYQYYEVRDGYTRQMIKKIIWDDIEKKWLVKDV